MPKVSYEGLLTLFLGSERGRGRGHGNLGTYRSVLRRFFRYLIGSRLRDIRSINEEHVTAFLRDLSEQKTYRGTPFSPVTVKTWLQILRRFFSFLESRRIILRNPTFVTLARVERLPRWVLNHSEAERLMEAADVSSLVGLRDRAVLELLYGTGIRAGECARLELRDVDLREGRLLVREGKGRRDRVVPLSGRAAAAIDIYLRESRPHMVSGPKEAGLFISYHRGRRVGIAAVQQLVAKCGRRAGFLRPLYPHTLRHTCATHLVQGGADIRHVQAILGHKVITSTERYTRVSAQDVRRMVNKSHPRERTRKAVK